MSDVLINHLQKSAPQNRGAVDHVVREFVDRFRVERIQSDTRTNWPTLHWEFDASRALVISAIKTLLEGDGFQIPGGIDFVRGRLTARFEAEYDGTRGWLSTIPRHSSRLKLAFEVDAEVTEHGAVTLRTSEALPSWTATFENKLRTRLAETPASWRDLAHGPESVSVDPHNPVLGPGEPLQRPFTGNLRDYSGFARYEDLADLMAGDLPLGWHAFVPPEPELARKPKGETHRGPLYLSRYRTGALMIYNGALICAPQNSGKTELIRRWAAAANRAGYNVFIIDVKGNMREKLAQSGAAAGVVRFFSTAPHVRNCDRVNFLSGLDGLTPHNSMRIRQLAEAVLPREGWEKGENAYFYQNHVNWLSGLIHIRLLHQQYCPQAYPGGRANLSHIYELASEEDALLRIIDEVQTKEAELVGIGKDILGPGLAYWFNEISLLIGREQRGQRNDREYTFRTLTQGIVNALRPFSRFGTLYEKTGGEAGERAEYGPYFSLEELNAPKDSSDPPVTIILAARQQDLDDASTVVSIVVSKLQQFLFDRMGIANLRPVLLLLDETRRIKGFKANEYITFAREAQAGCVIVYQSLDQIGEAAQIAEILENVGTQIYLGSLVGNTAKAFIESLPSRYRPTYSAQASFGTDGVSKSVQVGQEQIKFVTSNELFRLPAGKWPALIYINDQPRRNPILVDLDENLEPT
jgi:TraM recognition site of TraD and TraG